MDANRLHKRRTFPYAETRSTAQVPVLPALWRLFIP